MSGEFPDAATLAQVERERDNMQRRWVEGIISKTVDKATRDVQAEGRGEALLLWIDTNGELRARRICRESSRLLEFVPDYLKRGFP